MNKQVVARNKLDFTGRTEGHDQEQTSQIVLFVKKAQFLSGPGVQIEASLVGEEAGVVYLLTRRNFE